MKKKRSRFMNIDEKMGTMDVRTPTGMVRLGLVPVVIDGKESIEAEALMIRAAEWGVVMGNWHLYNLFQLQNEIPDTWFWKTGSRAIDTVILIPDIAFEDVTGMTYMMGLEQNELLAVIIDFHPITGTFDGSYYFLKTMPIAKSASFERHDDGLLGDSIGP